MRTKTLKKFQQGFSLVELAIVLVVIGVLLVPALHGYQLYLKDKRAEETEQALLQARNALGDFRAIYGRYPCPARATAVEGDADYGRESRAGGLCVPIAAPPGQLAVANPLSDNMALPDRNVYIGTLPFRQMNLPHDLVHDGQGNRLTYAVTGLLTDDDTYNNGNGGITILGLDDTDLTTPDAAHFVIISHNENDLGAIAREGARIGNCPLGTPDGENCDDDSTFRAGRTGDNFDDLVFYNVTDGIEQWQLSENNPQDIHLTRSTRFAIGAAENEDTTGFVEAEVKEIVSGDDTGTVVVSNITAAVPNAGKVLTPNLCDEDGLNCFHPRIIAGVNADDSTIYCDTADDPTDGGNYLVGIEGGGEKCANEIWFTCPSGQFVKGFEHSFDHSKVVCDVLPPNPCPTQNLTTTCGQSRSVSSGFIGGEHVGYAYSGMCYEIAALNTTEVQALVDSYPASQFNAAMNALRDYLDDNYNDLPRNAIDCAPTGEDALIRDTFECNDGVWNTTPVHTIEKLGPGNNLSSYAPYYSGGSFPAEAPGVAYNAADPMSVDPNNTDNYRDCWCREDYRVVTTSCGGSLSGSRFRIDRHNCPRTDHAWSRVYPTSSPYNTQFCGCVEGTSTSNISCAAHFDYSGSGIVGNVEVTNTITCPGGPSGSPVSTPTSYDISNCACPFRNDIKTTDPCPSGTTNSFTYDGVNYTGVENVYLNSWSCPGGPAPQPATSAADAGSYSGPVLVHGPVACTCDSSLTQIHVEACPAGYQGSGRTYLLGYDCATETYEAPSASNLQDDDCRQCIWQPGTLRPGIQSTAAAEEVGAPCPSCSGTTSCFDAIGPSNYKVWDGCYCAGQP